jgi:hypothetical protein
MQLANRDYSQVRDAVTLVPLQARRTSVSGLQDLDTAPPYAQPGYDASYDQTGQSYGDYQAADYAQQSGESYGDGAYGYGQPGYDQGQGYQGYDQQAFDQGYDQGQGAY